MFLFFVKLISPVLEKFPAASKMCSRIFVQSKKKLSLMKHEWMSATGFCPIALSINILQVCWRPRQRLIAYNPRRDCGVQLIAGDGASLFSFSLFFRCSVRGIKGPGIWLEWLHPGNTLVSTAVRDLSLSHHFEVLSVHFCSLLSLWPIWGRRVGMQTRYPCMSWRWKQMSANFHLQMQLMRRHSHSQCLSCSRERLTES